MIIICAFVTLGESSTVETVGNVLQRNHPEPITGELRPAIMQDCKTPRSAPATARRFGDVPVMTRRAEVLDETEAEEKITALKAQAVSIYPLMGIQAARRASRVGGGWRAYVICKYLDAQGVGRVKRDEARALALQLGVNPRTWDRWINEARNNDLLSDVEKADGFYFILPSAGRAGLAMGMDSIGPRKAIITLGALVGKGWKARVYSAWEDGKQISRETIQKTINVPLSTQRLRDSQAGTIRTRNYSKSKMTKDKLIGVIEHSHHKAPFVMRDGFIAWRLPDTRLSTCAAKGSKGRARKANRFIRNHAKPQTGLSLMRRALTDGELQREKRTARLEWVRLFNQDESQRLDTERKIIKKDLFVMDLYQRAQEAKSGAIIWKHYPMI